MSEFRIFDSREAASISVANHISGILRRAIEKRGQAACVVSGGRTPVMMFRALRRHVLPWEKVTLVPSDERLVAINHDDSNEGMIRHELMPEAAVAARLLSLVGVAGIADKESLAQINVLLARLSKPLDLVVLGMGDDGHTASLFPDSPDISSALRSEDYCVFQRPAGCTVGRLTLTPALLLDARKIVLLFFGQGKRTVYDRAVAGTDVAELPVRCVLRQRRTPVITFWAR